MTDTDVLLVEDVWADTFDERFRGLTVRRSPAAGRADLVAGTRALIVRNRTAVDDDLLAAAPRRWSRPAAVFPAPRVPSGPTTVPNSRYRTVCSSN